MPWSAFGTVTIASKQHDIHLKYAHILLYPYLGTSMLALRDPYSGVRATTTLCIGDMSIAGGLGSNTACGYVSTNETAWQYNNHMLGFTYCWVADTIWVKDWRKHTWHDKPATRTILGR
jgi:hypothetical protein